MGQSGCRKPCSLIKLQFSIMYQDIEADGQRRAIRAFVLKRSTLTTVTSRVLILPQNFVWSFLV